MTDEHARGERDTDDIADKQALEAIKREASKIEAIDKKMIADAWEKLIKFNENEYSWMIEAVKEDEQPQPPTD